MSRATFDRSATFAWSPRALGNPLLATGTVAGALDESFSSESKLELWDPFPPSQVSDENAATEDFFQSQGPVVKGSVQAPARFSRLSWGYVHEPDRPKGVLASGLESGELAIWDPTQVLASNSNEALIWNNKHHSGPVRGLDFNKGQPHVLATGATNGEIWVWDLNTPEKPYSPGNRSRNLSDITSLAWNRKVSHILASSSTSGYTVVWDLKGRREVVALNYAAPQAMNPGQPWMGGPQQPRAGLSAVSWHPENATKLATASEDDLNPVVMLWDLRNPRAPERILSGHEKGILSMNWCAEDPDLLVSCGKDSRTILWNPNTGESVGELSRTTNWSFESSWCPRLPDLLAVGSFDGKIDVHSLQATTSATDAPAEAPSGADIFEQGNLNVQSFPAVSLKQAPKWTKRPVAATFGFGGKLVSVNAAHGASVKVHHVVTEPDVVERAVKLDYVLEHQGLADFAKERSTGADLPTTSTSAESKENETWKLLQTLFNTDNREELVALLGFSKEDVKTKVDDAIKRFKEASGVPNQLPRSTSGLSNSSQAGDDESGSAAREPLVTFAEEPSQQDELGAGSEGEAAAAASTVAAPSESGASTGPPDSTKTLGEGTEITEPSLFGDEAPGQQQAAADFYSSIRSNRPTAIPDHLYAGGEREQSSIAATIGSRASSVASMDQLRESSTFKIYPSDESETDKLLTRSLILGDFQSAVALCLATDRFADALLLSTRGGPELMASTQKAYFERHTSSTPYLRLFQSVASNDLGDIVQNADLADWQEVFVVLCTFARKDEFANFVESLGQRIEFAAVQSRNSNADEALKLRKNALLCYLAAQRLERVVGIFAEEMKEEEAADEAPKSSAHAKALQTFVEKIAVFKAATSYVDSDLATPTSTQAVAASGARVYKLGSLYDRYLEYAELLSSQGLSTLALNYVSQVPADYQATEQDDTTAHVRERLLANAGKSTKALPASKVASKAAPAVPVGGVPRAPGYAPAPAAAPGLKPAASPALGGNPFSAYGASAPQAQQLPGMPPVAPASQAPYGQAARNPYGPASQPMAPAQNPYAPSPQPAAPAQNPYAPAPQPMAPAQNPYAPSPSNNSYMPRASTGPSGGPPPPPPVSSTIKRPDQGWNDAPKMPSAPPPKRAPSAAPPRSQVTSPFPGAAPPPTMPPPPPMASQSFGVRPPSAAGTMPPPPPAMGTSGPPPPARGMSPALAMQPPPSRSGLPPGPPPPMTSTPMGGPPPSMPPPMSNAGPYAPAPQAQMPMSSMPPAPSPYLPAAQPAQPPPMMGMGSPQPSMPAPKPAAAAPPPKPEPPKPKYPAGDRSHIPDADRPIYDVLLEKLQVIRANVPAAQKRMVDDTERRLNVLFDALNCETLSQDTVAQLHQIIEAIQSGDANYALELHLQLLTSGPSSDNLTAWMPAVKVIARTA